MTLSAEFPPNRAQADRAGSAAHGSAHPHAARRTFATSKRRARAHRVAIVAFDGVVPFDLATPYEVFERVRLPDGGAPYQVQVCGARRELDAGAFGIKTRVGLSALRHADTVFVPGLDDLDRPIEPALLRALRRAAERGARLASICTGAFVLAAAGLLDGRRATTHWRAAPELARRHPSIEVDAKVLYVDGGQLLTSAGAAAGLDLCLHMVRCDHGAAVAAEVARASVMPLERAGGQAQFIAHEPPVDRAASLAPLLNWMRQNLQRDLPLPELARRAAMSTRTLHRRFREQTGTTPAQWLLRARVHRAQQLLETCDSSVEQIAEQAGFGSAATFRQRFRRVLGTSPQAYRNAFRR